ncbi:MAG: CRISPR locus-related DNA-binding protein [Thermogladius sp.]|jgi:CRISPR locus-related DNA-binding protein|nr:CRISPR locus-related DNA-binding protein [Thermogladius sp.]
MRLLITPLGFHEDAGLRLLTRYRASPSDRFIVVTCRPVVAGVSRAFESLRASCLRQGFPMPELVDVPCGRFYEAFPTLLRKLRSLGEAGEAVVEIGVGPRIVSHLITLVLERLGWRYSLHYEPETGFDEPVEIPWGFIEAVKEKLSKSEEELLRLVLSGRAPTVVEASRATGWSEKTVRNIASRLKAKGLLVKKSRREVLEATEYARALYSE